MLTFRVTAVEEFVNSFVSGHTPFIGDVVIAFVGIRAYHQYYMGAVEHAIPYCLPPPFVRFPKSGTVHAEDIRLANEVEHGTVFDLACSTRD